MREQDLLDRLWLEGFTDTTMIGSEIHVTARLVPLVISLDGDEFTVAQADGNAIAVLCYDVDEVVDAVKSWR
jgi:hypothetical protein